MPLIREYQRLLRKLRIAYYEAARDHLTRTNPCHDDLPLIVHRINQLRSES